MGFAYRKQIPGKADINETFSKKNLTRTKKLYEKLVKSGQYRFGDLTASFCGLDQNQENIWLKEVADFYPPDVQREIIRTVDAALLHKDDKGAEVSVPVEFRWGGELSNGKTQGIRATYDPSGPSYLIEIVGYPSPLRSLLSARGAGDAEEAD
jgi:hypothetical protein